MWACGSGICCPAWADGRPALVPVDRPASSSGDLVGVADGRDSGAIVVVCGLAGEVAQPIDLVENLSVRGHRQHGQALRAGIAADQTQRVAQGSSQVEQLPPEGVTLGTDGIGVFVVHAGILRMPATLRPAALMPAARIGIRATRRAVPLARAAPGPGCLPKLQRRLPADTKAIISRWTMG